MKWCFIGKLYFFLFYHIILQIVIYIFSFCPDNVAKNVVPDDFPGNFDLYILLPDNNEDNSQAISVLLLSQNTNTNKENENENVVWDDYINNDL